MHEGGKGEGAVKVDRGQMIKLDDTPGVWGLLCSGRQPPKEFCTLFVLVICIQG